MQIAFYNGNHREKLTVLAAFKKLTDHLRKFLEFKVLIGVIDNIVAKCKYVTYCKTHIKRQYLYLINILDFATFVGFHAVSMPFFKADHPLLTGNNKTERFRVIKIIKYF